MNYLNRWLERTSTQTLYNQNEQVMFTKSQTESGVMVARPSENTVMVMSEKAADKKYNQLLVEGWSTKPLIADYKVWQVLTNQFAVFYQDGNGNNVHCEVCKNVVELKSSLVTNLL